MALISDETPVRRSTGNRFFLWAVVLIVMTGMCFASWIGSFYVVGHPENPKCYRILKKFKRVEPPRRFPVTKAPKGEFLGAQKLLDRFGKLGKLAMENENALLMRNYVTNFAESGRPLTYVAGKFQVVQSFALGKSDWFPSGAVAVAQAETAPQLLVEFVFPAAPENVAAIRETVAMGADVNLQRSQDLWAVVHVERYEDGRMQFTVMPLPYGGWQLKGGQGNFQLQSPEELLRDRGFELNLAAGLPLVRDPRLSAALAAHKDFRRKALARAGDDQAALAGPELVRYEPEIAVTPDAGAPKNGDEARSPNEQAVPAPTPVTNPRRAQIARPVPTPAPAVPLPPRPVVRTKPNSAIIGAQPVAVATPTPAAQAVAVAPTAPGSRALTTAEASGMVDHFSASGAKVLSGDFVVTGVLGRRVALRTSESLRDPNADPAKAGGNAALIVVEYPEGVAIPEKGATFRRDAERGFVIRDVIRGRNGQITIVVNERMND